MTDRLATIHRRQRRDIRLLYATLSDAVENAIARQTRQKAGGEAITEADRQAVMREVDAALDVIWGRFPGDPDGAIRQVVLRDTRAARLQPLDAAVREWRKAMPRGLRGLIETEARRG